MTAATDLQLAANTIRCLAMDAVQKAESGHPGMPMGMADASVVLWTEFVRWSAKDPSWLGRDRFVLSAGHGSMLIYSLLHLSGFEVSMDDLKQFRQLHSKTPGHPEVGETAGIETTTGPLGAGFSNAVGMAIAAHLESAQFENPLLKTRVFAICGDGCLMEGISHESASLAGHLGLDNLVCLWDDNGITIEGHTDIAFSDDTKKRFESYGWRVLSADGHEMEQVRAALRQAVTPSDRPTLICCKTTIGKGSPNKKDTHEVHGSPLGADEIKLAKEALGMPQDAFFVDARCKAVFAHAATNNEAARHQWQSQMLAWEKAKPEHAAKWRSFRERAVPANLYAELQKAAGDAPSVATRVLSGNVIQKAAELVPSMVGGSADLDPSTKTRIKKSSSFSKKDRAGRNFHFGVREHGMGGVLNGLALHGGFLPMGSTFLVFADYMRPAIRLAALMKQPVTFVFTHDSLMVGEDGPTHQPVEQLASLRLIPNVHVFRPADGLETAAAWTHALTRRDGPVCLSLTRQNLPVIARAAGFDPHAALRGGYVVRDEGGAQATILATGAEVSLALETAAVLQKSGTRIRVVSMPCVELFLEQPPAWQKAVLGEAPLFALEMGKPELWCRFTGRLDRCIGQETFGASAPAKKLAEHFGFVADAVAQRIRAAL